MSDLPQPTPQPVPGAEGTQTPAGRGLIMPVLHLCFGLVSIALAASEDFAQARASFVHEAWRIPLGLAGAGIAYLGVRGIVRVLGGHRRALTPEVRRRARISGRVIFLVGLWFLVTALSDGVARNSIEFHSWAGPLYVAGGIYLMLAGLGLQHDPTNALRRQRLMRGEGVPGTATILRASDTGRIVSHIPEVKIDFEFDLGGHVMAASDKIVMEGAKLALLVPGSTVGVVVDRADPSVFYVDWDSWRPPSGTTDR